MRKSSGGYRFNPDCRRVTILEYLKLGYGRLNQNMVSKKDIVQSSV